MAPFCIPRSAPPCAGPPRSALAGELISLLFDAFELAALAGFVAAVAALAKAFGA